MRKTCSGNLFWRRLTRCFHVNVTCSFFQTPDQQLTSQQENVFEILRTHDALVAADTSTHLEATLLNVSSMYYRFSPGPTVVDYYGYAAHGLSE
jgi:hypothetical protein